MLNIWISTTLDWNFGDNIIERGIRQVMAKAMKKDYIRANKIFYNRNYDLQTPDMYRFPYNNVKGNYDNDGLIKYDLAVAAGSPEFFGGPMLNFYRHIMENDIPLLVLGVGTTWDDVKIDDLTKAVLKRPNTLITTRGPKAAEIINEAIGQEKAVAKVCPALFSSSFKSIPKHNVAQILQAPGRGPHLVPEHILKGSTRNFDTLCVHKKEFVHYTKLNYPARIFDSPADMLHKIGEYKKVVSTRLHGAFASLSLGNSAVVVHDNNQRIRDACFMLEGLLPQAKDVAQGLRIKGADPEKIDRFRWEKYDDYVKYVSQFIEGGLNV